MVRAKLGDHISEGEGTSIKKAKHAAATKMLLQLGASEPKMEVYPNMHPAEYLTSCA